MSVRTYTTMTGDTLESIALRFMGEAKRWPDLARFNRLHAPYISDDPRDYYGQPMATGFLPEPVGSGQTTIPVSPAVDELVVEYGGVLLLMADLPTGGVMTDVMTVSGFDIVTGIIAVLAGPANAWMNGASWYLYAAHRPTHVLRPGDTCYIDDGRTPTNRALDRFFDLFGTDIAITETGELFWGAVTQASGQLTLTPTGDGTLPFGATFQHQDALVTALATTILVDSVPVEIAVRAVDPGGLGVQPVGTVMTLIPSSVPPATAAIVTTATVTTGIEAVWRIGDVATVTGYDNLAQALLTRVSTEPGELVYHPGYGNAAYRFIGLSNTAVNHQLGLSFTMNCVAQDDRVAAVLDGGSDRDTDLFNYIVVVQPRGTSERLTIDQLRLRVSTGSD